VAEAVFAIGVLNIDSVQKQHVEMYVQVERRSEALDQGDRPGGGFFAGQSGLLGQVGGDRPGDDTQHPAHQLRVGGKQEAQRERDREHPLADRSERQYFVHQQGGAFHHAAGAATRAKTSSLTGESYQLLVVAAFAAYPQKSLFQPAALQVVGELLLHVIRQRSAFGFQIGEERGVMLLDEPVEQCRFWLVASVAGRGSGNEETVERGS